MYKIKSLEGLRGIATLMVLFSHLKLTCFIDSNEFLINYIEKSDFLFGINIFFVNILKLVTNGDLAVWIFWIMSSFVISINFFRNEHSDLNLLQICVKRYFRLAFPVLFVVIFTYFLLKLNLVFNKDLAQVLGLPYSKTYDNQESWLNSQYLIEPNLIYALKFSLFDTFFNYNENLSYNTSLWTIQNEFIGSLFTFSLFGIVKLNSKRFYFYFIILLILYFLNLIWLCAFVCGHTFCDLIYSQNTLKESFFIKNFKNQNLYFFSFVFSILVLPTFFEHYKLNYFMLNLIVGLITVIACLKSKLLIKYLSINFFQFLGNISFGVYLIHIPIITSLTSYLLILDHSSLGKFIISLITILVVLLFGYFFSIFIDKKSVIAARKISLYFQK